MPFDERCFSSGTPPDPVRQSSLSSDGSMMTFGQKSRKPNRIRSGPFSKDDKKKRDRTEPESFLRIRTLFPCHICYDILNRVSWIGLTGLTIDRCNTLLDDQLRLVVKSLEVLWTMMVSVDYQMNLQLCVVILENPVPQYSGIYHRTQSEKWISRISCPEKHGL